MLFKILIRPFHPTRTLAADILRRLSWGSIQRISVSLPRPPSFLTYPHVFSKQKSKNQFYGRHRETWQRETYKRSQFSNRSLHSISSNNTSYNQQVRKPRHVFSKSCYYHLLDVWPYRKTFVRLFFPNIICPYWFFHVIDIQLQRPRRLASKVLAEKLIYISTLLCLLQSMRFS